MKINIIACINSVDAIGKDNKLLYRIPSDLLNFKLLTDGRVIIMGRNTYESLPKKPLKNRIHIIISSDADYTPTCREGETVYVVNSIDAAIQTAETFGIEEVFVIGGASVYRQFMEQDNVDKLFITLVEDEEEGDVHFPAIEDSKWQLRSITDAMTHLIEDEETHQVKNLNYQFLTYERKE